MSCCGQCGSTRGCTCNEVGCVGQAIYIVGHMIVITIMCGVFVFMAPGLIYHYAAGSHIDKSQDFVHFAINDKRTWVLSAVVWIGLGIWQFHRFTRVEPPAKSEADGGTKRVGEG